MLGIFLLGKYWFLCHKLNNKKMLNTICLCSLQPQGMVQAAVYMKSKLFEEKILETAFNRNLERHTDTYRLVLVGHSLGTHFLTESRSLELPMTSRKKKLLQIMAFYGGGNISPIFFSLLVYFLAGAGTASILAVLLKKEYPNLKCYAYSPPGGLFR